MVIMKGKKVFLLDPDYGRDLIFCTCYYLEVHQRNGEVLVKISTLYY